MGLFDILFGNSGSSKPKVTKEEFKKVRGDLSVHGFTEHERDRVEEIFSGDLYEQVNSSTPKGIDEQEITDRIAWLRTNKDKHPFSDQKITIIENTLRKYLKKY